MKRLYIRMLTGLFLQGMPGILLSAAPPGQGFALVNRLPLTFHPSQGRDLPGASLLRYYGGRFYLARRFGIQRIDPVTGKGAYIPLPPEAGAARISDFCIRDGIVWILTVEGHLLRRGLKRRWRLFKKGLDGFGVLQCRPSGLALGSGRDYYQLIRTQFPDAPLFSFPGSIPVRIRSLLDGGFWKYLGTDMGLFRVNTQGERSWESLGSRFHLSKAHIQDIAQGEEYLVLAASRVQYPRLPANIRLTGYGTFIYNYFQKRWERLNGGEDPRQHRFIRLNRENREVPPGGIWVYRPPLPYSLSGVDFVKYRRILAGCGVAAGRSGDYLAALFSRVYGRSGNRYLLKGGDILRSVWVLGRALEELGHGEGAIRYGTPEGLDFLRVIRLDRGDYLAATRRGLYRFRKEAGGWRLKRIARYGTRFIDDILLGGGQVAVLSGDQLFLSRLPIWTGKETAPGDRIPDRGSALPPADNSEVERFRMQMERYLRGRMGE